mgnify:CR=1 FL=1
MLFISPDDFFQKVRGVTRLSRSDEKIFAWRITIGSATAEEKGPQEGSNLVE